MFYSFVQSYSNYNIINWSCTKPSFLDPIEKKIKKAIRIISFAKTRYDHTEPLFKQHRILPFRKLVQYRKAVFMWKITNGYAPKVLSESFVSNEHEQNNKKFVLPHPPNDTAKEYFVYSCVQAWNCLPDVLRGTTIYTAFTRNLKKHFLGEPIEDSIHINNNIRNTNQNNANNNNGIRVLQWVRPNMGQLRANAQQNPFADRWDNQLRNF